tara:strand:+ start:2933 stop:3190 length:258 start_codon:yes stop_codon:yes gene_type:complete
MSPKQNDKKKPAKRCTCKPFEKFSHAERYKMTYPKLVNHVQELEERLYLINKEENSLRSYYNWTKQMLRVKKAVKLEQDIIKEKK